MFTLFMSYRQELFIPNMENTTSNQHITQKNESDLVINILCIKDRQWYRRIQKKGGKEKGGNTPTAGPKNLKE